MSAEITRDASGIPLPSAHAVTFADLSDKDWRTLWHDARVGWAIAKQVRDLRASRGWTRAELARRAGLSTLTIYRAEHEKYTPTITSLLKIAEAFDVALEARLVEWSEWLRAQRALETRSVPPSFDEEIAAEVADVEVSQ